MALVLDGIEAVDFAETEAREVEVDQGVNR